MAAAFAVRPLVEAELAAWKALRDRTLVLHPDAFSSDAAESAATPPEAYRHRLGTERPDGGVFTLGAWQDGLLAGAVSAERETRNKVRHTVHLTAMMVRADLARRGIGRALLEAAVDACRAAEGVEQVTLSVTATNLAAVALYTSSGFVRYGTLPRALHLPGRGYFAKDLMVKAL